MDQQNLVMRLQVVCPHAIAFGLGVSLSQVAASFAGGHLDVLVGFGACVIGALFALAFALLDRFLFRITPRWSITSVAFILGLAWAYPTVVFCAQMQWMHHILDRWYALLYPLVAAIIVAACDRVMCRNSTVGYLAGFQRFEGTRPFRLRSSFEVKWHP